MQVSIKFLIIFQDGNHLGDAAVNKDVSRATGIVLSTNMLRCSLFTETFFTFSSRNNEHYRKKEASFLVALLGN